ncbi:MAG: CDP-alcohol phosphatidyltransferase family protein [Bryobacterales bacterium]
MNWSLLRVANALTILRLVAVPLVIWVIYQTGSTLDLDWIAVSLVVALQVTDILDGYLARQAKHGDTRRINPLGEVLDPIADKLYINGAFLTLMWIDRIPLWAGGVIVARDFLIAMGWTLKYVLTSVRLLPNMLGKAADSSHALALVVVMARPAVSVSNAVLILAAALTVASGISYTHMALTAKPAATSNG